MLGDEGGMQLVMIQIPSMTRRIISKRCLYNYHSKFLLTSGNKEMKFLLVAFKTPRMTQYLIFQMIFSLTLRCLMSMLST
jgi:hypothetical protein